MTIEGLRNYIKHPLRLFSYLGSHGLLNWMPDSTYLKLAYRVYMGKKLNLVSPKSFNEKLQWLKIHNRKDIYTTMVDKYCAKEYVSNILGEEYVIPTLGVWNKFEDIEFGNLPDQFVLKCTHDSGGLVICRDKNVFDQERARRIINKCLKRNYYNTSREWPYKNVKPRIIAEPYVVDKATNSLNDYKFFCFNGKVKCFKVDFNRFVKHQANYYDKNCKLLPFGEKDFPRDPSADIKIPPVIDEMKKMAEIIAVGQPFLRVDFYYANNHIYFGEITFYPATGFGKIEPEEWDSILGEWIDLRMITKKNGDK